MPIPTPMEITDLDDKSDDELRALIKAYTDEVEDLETRFNTAFNTFNAREAIYVKIFGKLSVIGGARDALFSQRPSDGITAVESPKIEWLHILGTATGATAVIQTIMLFDSLNDVRLVRGTVATTKISIVKLGMIAPGSSKNVADLAYKSAAKLRKVRIRSAFFGAVAVTAAVVAAVSLHKSQKEARKQMREAIPEYAAWFTEIEEAISQMDDQIGEMNLDIATIVTETSTGTEAKLLEYLDASISEIGSFQALYNSAYSMLVDKNDGGSGVSGLTNAKIAAYTGLPEDYIDIIEQSL